MSITPLSAPKPIQTSPTAPRYQWIWAPAIFATLTLAMFFDLLFTANRVVSHVTTDLSMQFLPWREFGFGEIKRGNFPLWNPYVYGGAPFFAGFQSALLYPPNWLHLFMPVPLAINWIVALHVFALGYFTYFWCRGRGIGIGGSILAGVMIMFSGPYFLHLYAGHLPHLAIIAWAPLMLLALDKLAATGSIRWALFGVFVTSMQILAGHPQYVYYTGIALSIYVVLLMIQSPNRWRLAGGFVLMYTGAVLVTAVQLLTGLQTAGELVRSGGMSYETAATFSLPVENLITLFVPTFFQNVPMTDAATELSYWGCGYLWEMTLFISISGVVLALLGAVRHSLRSTWAILVMAGITLLLALGRHTFLYRPMFDYLPGYGSFRGTVKFAYLFVIFVSLLAAMGLDSLLAQRKVSVWFIALVAAMAIYGLTMTATIAGSRNDGPGGIWGRCVGSVIDGSIINPATGESENYNPALFQLKRDATFLSQIGLYSEKFTALAAGTLLLITALLWASRFHRWVPYALLVLASVEMFCFARATRATMDPQASRAVPAAWADTLAKISNTDYRVLIAPLNYWARGMYYGVDNLSGNDPGIFRRFAELMYAAAGDSHPVQQYIPINQALISNFKVMRLLRCPFLFYNPENTPAQLLTDPFPVALLFSEWQRITNPSDALATTVFAKYDPAKLVIVEDEPEMQMMPSPNPPGTVQIVKRSTDSLEFQIDLQRNAILLVTNNYSNGWRVVPIESDQRNFKVMPANYSQIGIPLQPGKHHLILEYSPLSFRLGRWISLLSILGFGAWSIWLMRHPARGR